MKIIEWYNPLMKTYVFRSIIEPDDPKGFHGFVPSLPGLHTFGDTMEKVKNNLEEAIRCHIEGLVMDGEPIPQECEQVEVIHSFSEEDFAVHAKAPRH